MLPWCHRARIGVADCNFDVFRHWAIHKGRMNPGSQVPIAKATLRCAINASKYIEALPELDKTNFGRASYKAFKFTENFVDVNAAYILLEMYDRMVAANGLMLLSLES